MKIILCLDKNSGMMFNKRRQSRDIVVIEDINNNYQPLCRSEYSKELFVDVIVSDQLLEDDFNGYCFVEDKAVVTLDGIEELIIYHWNRNYPGDMFFKYDLKAEGFKNKKVNLIGNSHEKITKEEWIRV